MMMGMVMGGFSALLRLLLRDDLQDTGNSLFYV